MRTKRQTGLVHPSVQGRLVGSGRERREGGGELSKGGRARKWDFVLSAAGGTWQVTPLRTDFLLQSARARCLLSELLGTRMLGIGQTVSGSMFLLPWSRLA